MKLGILGGTFDPIHEGHLSLARAAKKQFRLDRVIFVPAYIPPHKTNDPDLSPAEHRYRMTELALQGKPEFEISDEEYRRKSPSYTVETLRSFKKRYPESELFLIMGEDSLRELPTWKEPEHIQKLATLLVAHRSGVTAQSDVSEKVNWVEMSAVEVSASEIRLKIQKGEHIESSVLPKQIASFIQKLKLYREN